MTPEQESRQDIDRQLVQTGWIVQDYRDMNISAGPGVAVREFPLATGKADYLLYVYAKALGGVEAKPKGHTLVGVEEQSEMYVVGVPKELPHYVLPLPFTYESTGKVTQFTNRLDPNPRSREVFTFHRPEELLRLVPNTARLCVMNLYLHGIDADPCPVRSGVDSLASHPGEHFSVVLTNPPFGKKSTIAIVTEEGELEKEDTAYERQDFWTTTKNKQLNFLQHVKSLLKINGRCAIVLPDNVLFEGGAGETVRRNLLQQCDVHTLLRLPTGIFYAQGVKANVLFFDSKPAQEKPWTKKLWVYDLRTNMHFTLKTNPLKRADLDDFVACYNPKNRHRRKPTWTEETPEGRWRCFDYDEIIKRDKANLDIFWLRDQSLEDSDDLPDPDVLAQEIADDLQTALDQFSSIAGALRE